MCALRAITVFARSAKRVFAVVSKQQGLDIGRALHLRCNHVSPPFAAGVAVVNAGNGVLRECTPTGVNRDDPGNRGCSIERRELFNTLVGELLEFG